MLAPGDRAPEVKLDQPGGGSRSLSQILEQGPALLAFFKVGCPTCQLTLPYLERIWQGRREGAPQMFAVSQDDAGATAEFNRSFGLSLPTLLDSERKNYPASNAFGISHVPSLFLVDRDGAVSWTLDGFNKQEIAALGARAGVEPFREGEDVPEWKAG